MRKQWRYRKRKWGGAETNRETQQAEKKMDDEGGEKVKDEGDVDR